MIRSEDVKYKSHLIAWQDTNLKKAQETHSIVVVFSFSQVVFIQARLLKLVPCVFCVIQERMSHQKEHEEGKYWIAPCAPQVNDSQ